jgi:hypothetical protein
LGCAWRLLRGLAHFPLYALSRRGAGNPHGGTILFERFRGVASLQREVCHHFNQHLGSTLVEQENRAKRTRRRAGS